MTHDTAGNLVLVEERRDTYTTDGRGVGVHRTEYRVLSTERRLALADVLRAAASRIVGGEDPGVVLGDMRAAVQAWELGT